MPVAVIALLVVIALLASTFDLSGTLLLNHNFQNGDYTTLLTNLAFISLVLERFIEVFNSIWRRKGKLPLARAVEHAAPANKQQAVEALDAYRQQTETYTMLGGFGIGIVVSLGGVHTLQVLFDATGIHGLQLILFQATDILLTAGLLSGGSKGINKVTNLFGVFLERSAEKAQEAGKG